MKLIASTIADAVKQINTARTQNKNKWVFLEVNVNDLNYQFKFFNTWIQIAKLGEMKDSSGMDISVKQFKEYLTKFMEA